MDRQEYDGGIQGAVQALCQQTALQGGPPHVCLVQWSSANVCAIFNHFTQLHLLSLPQGVGVSAAKLHVVGGGA